MHLALARPSQDPAFGTEPFTLMYQRSIYQSMRSLSNRVFATMRKMAPTLPEDVQPEAASLLQQQGALLTRYRAVVDRRIIAKRSRYHGDYHLGQVLHSGRDFTIIDFEGEPMRPLNERRMKRSPLRDVAGMIRSFDYAAWTALTDDRTRGLIAPDDPVAVVWARYWYRWVAATFLKGYLERAENAAFLPTERENLELLLDIFLLDKAVYELNYEMNNRPDWVRIPLRGLLDLLAVPEMVTA
jgi:maltose alpha-D-glucosyltransferase/alpha-amylase